MFPIMIQTLILAVLVSVTFPFAFADDADTSDFSESINGVFDFIDNIAQENIDQSEMDEQTTENVQLTLDSGIESGKTGVKLWFSVHEFFVNLIFAGTTEADLPIDKDLIVVISMFAVFFIMIGLVMHLIRQNTKIALIIVVILVILGMAGIVIEF
jgi:hypothetical protein